MSAEKPILAKHYGKNKRFTTAVDIMKNVLKNTAGSERGTRQPQSVEQPSHPAAQLILERLSTAQKPKADQSELMPRIVLKRLTPEEIKQGYGQSQFNEQLNHSAAQLTLKRLRKEQHSKHGHSKPIPKVILKRLTQEEIDHHLGLKPKQTLPSLTIKLRQKK